MTRIDDITRGELASILKRLRALEKATPLSSTSVGNGTLRFYAGSELSIEDGNLTVSGTATVTGELTGGGTFSWTGPVTLTGTTTMTGTTDLNGPVNINGNAHITGDTTNSGDFTVDSAGKITVAGGVPMTIGITSSGEPGLGWSNGYIASDGSRIVMAAGSAGLVAIPGNSAALIYGANSVGVGASGSVVTGDLNVTNAFSAATKSFKIPHPTKPHTWLLHGVTESDTYGVEYWGEATLDSSGAAVVELPSYFEALTSPDRRAVLVTCRGGIIDWTDIVEGKFTVTGDAGRKISWLVKASRADAVLVVEEPMVDPDMGDLTIDPPTSPPAQ